MFCHAVESSFIGIITYILVRVLFGVFVKCLFNKRGFSIGWKVARKKKYPVRGKVAVEGNGKLRKPLPNSIIENK